LADNELVRERSSMPARFKNRAWIPVTWLLSILNVVAVGVYSRQAGQGMHVTMHAVLAVGFALGAMRLGSRRTLAAESDVRDQLREIEERLAELDATHGLERRLPELEERIDFLERALVEVRNRPQIPPKLG